MKKILITFIEAGFGHITTAQAILEALQMQELGDVEIIGKYMFRDSELLQRFENFFIQEVKRANIIPGYSRIQTTATYLIGPQNSLRLVFATAFKAERDAYVEELREIQPDVIIDTHYMASHASVYYKRHYNKNVKVITYNPDNNVHSWWDHRVDYFIVNNGWAGKDAIKQGFKPEQVKVVPFVTRQGVTQTILPKTYYREKYGIPNDKMAVMVAAGAYGKSGMSGVLEKLLKTQKPLTIIAIAGKNKKLYRKLEQQKNNLPDNITLLPFEFVDEVYELNRAADLFLTKGGPNAILDSVLVEVPIVVYYNASMIESQTCKLFTKYLGCGVKIKNKQEILEFVEACVDNPEKLEPYKHAEHVLASQPNGANTIAEFIKNIVKQ